MGLRDEEERKRRGLWYTITAALEEIRLFFPDAVKDKNSIGGWIFSIILQGMEFLKKMSSHFSMYPVDLRQNLSSEELQAEGAQEFLDKIRDFSDQHREQLLEKWRQDPKDRSLAWVALAEHFLNAGNDELDAAKTIIDKQLYSIQNKAMLDNPENIVDLDLARAFEKEIFLIEKAELVQIAMNNDLKIAIVRDKEERNLDSQHHHENLLEEGKEQLKHILGVGKRVITLHYDLYKEIGIPAPAVAQDNRPDPRALEVEFERLNRGLNRVQLP